MKSILLLASLGALAPAASALTLTLENPIVAATVPATGTATYALRGTIVLSPGETFAGGGAADALDPSLTEQISIRSNALPISSALAATSTYTGTLAFLDVESTDPAGRYAVDATGFDMPYVAFFVNTPQGTTVTSYATYAVEVAPVPEPASLSILGLGAVGLLRHRRRR